MKVLQINAVYGIGSTGTIVKDIGEMLYKQNNECYFAFQKCNTFPPNGYKMGNIFDEKIHAIHTRIFGKQAYASKIETFFFLKWIKKIKPDVIHLHNLHSNYINLNMLLKYLSKNDIATVITMHDCWYFTGKCFHYIEYNCNRWKNQCGNCPQKHNNVNSLFFDQSKKVLEDKKKYITSIPRLKIIGCSKWIVDECKKSLLKECDIDFIHNGIDTSIFKPTKNEFKYCNSLQNKFLILGFANKWEIPVNKIAVEKIIELLNDDDRIILIGCSKKTKNKYKTNNKIVCLDYIRDKKVLADIYSSCNVFVNLTHADTLPTVNMESICSGTPVITYDVCGSSELVKKEYGFIVKKDNINNLLECIKVIKSGPFLIDIKKAINEYDKEINYLKYLEVYNELKH